MGRRSPLRPPRAAAHAPARRALGSKRFVVPIFRSPGESAPPARLARARSPSRARPEPIRKRKRKPRARRFAARLSGRASTRE
ncbi:hypothetical protein C7S16_5503 [Burkholderia thailandensis]|uniref:Uncharacterized protein n=1 Tax=Burkholderia thailandensis TaxID=57975 RepID=A0AAW9CV39_BURTH|nr:hypothetical protein [Burkholderia thailandensis]